MFGAPVFTSGALVLVAASQGIPLDHLPLIVRRAYLPGSHGTATSGGTVLDRVPHPGYCTDSIVKHTSSLSVKEAYVFVLELWP